MRDYASTPRRSGKERVVVVVVAVAAVAVAVAAAARALDHTVGTSHSAVDLGGWAVKPAVVTISVAGTLIHRLER